jgi:magnesium-transporting ATPase (P-type)
MAFSYFGITAKEVRELDNRFFSDYPIGDYLADNGKVYTIERQHQIMRVIHGTYYLTIVTCQACHIWTCRTMTMSIFEHGVFSNAYTNFGVPISLALGFAVVYFPPLQYMDGSGGAIISAVLVVTGFCFVALWGWSELRKWVLRAYPDEIFTSLLRW